MHIGLGPSIEIGQCWRCWKVKVRNKEGGWRRRQNYALTLIESLESTIRTTPSQPMLRPLTPNTTESSRCPTIAEWNILFLFVPSLMCLQYQKPIVRERVRVYVCEYFYLGNIISAFNCNWHKLLLFDAILIFFSFHVLHLLDHSHCHQKFK